MNTLQTAQSGYLPRLVRRRHYTFDELPAHRKREAVALLRKRAEARLRYAGEERPYEWAEWFAPKLKWKLYSSEDGMIVDLGAWGCIEAEALKSAPHMRYFQHVRSSANVKRMHHYQRGRTSITGLVL